MKPDHSHPCHPLDPATSEELAIAANTIKSLYDVRLHFKAAGLQKPKKELMLKYLESEHANQPRPHVPRCMFIMWYIHWTPRLFEAVVDVEKKIVLSHTEMSRDFHGPCDRTELSGAAAAALEDAQVKKEIARLQLKETSIVLDPWDYGVDGEETQERHTTPYQDGQLFPAGEYTNQSLGGTGISFWESIKTHAPIRNRDTVVWHTFGFTHNPRVEDFPVMPAEIAHVHLKPYNFALSNPSNDVPQSTQSMNKSVLFDAGAVAGAESSISSCCTPPITSSSKL